MKDTIKITDEIQCHIEKDGNYLYLWIEKATKHWFWGVAFEKCSHVIAYELTLGEDRDTGIEMHGLFAGRHGRAALLVRNVDTFDIEVEVSKLYHQYQQDVEYRDKLRRSVERVVSL